ncbi:cell surface protein SprA [Siphonobacter sp. SORGH_AS_0500]|uniref:T9SS outer membrane translocon Sov/SprA n=1 Tax=Siphonobacter sp. SORGH_AS_0500 TaxID=1864824 RepID=UPI002860DB01|nr:cell surface protein SprA [Siphonobacter sp. SORGH_AS_0500]MDR6193648.1 cell surface protein SprA [Siphonobacter sp. SORGH_AS_0500]
MRIFQPVRKSGVYSRRRRWITVPGFIRAFFLIGTTFMVAKGQVVRPDSVQQDTLYRTKTGRRPYLKVPDRLGSRFSYRLPQSPLVPHDPKTLQTQFRYDPNGQRIIVDDHFRVGDTHLPYRTGEAISLDEYLRIQNDASYRDLIREYAARSDGKSEVSGRGLFPKIKLTDPSLDRIFGSNIIDFLPNGSVMLDFGYLHQNIDNPAIPVRQRRTGNFIFNEQIAINFAGKIGDKLNLNTNFDTKAAFNFENKLKLGFRNQEEDIIQRVEAGNTSFRTNSQLIPSVENLFGANVALRFGKLDVNIVAAQQRSKRQSMTLKNGAQNRPFSIREDLYDENRHFFLSHFFRDNYERSLQQLPMITSGVNVTRVEVYVTNRSQSTETLRNLVGLTDMGEGNPYNRTSPLVQPISGSASSPASNAINGLFQNVSQNPVVRQIDNVASELTGSSYTRGIDFDILRGARKLGEREFKFHPQLGYISLLTPVRNDEVIAVAYEYTYQGRSYKVGELTEDYQNRQQDEVIVLKLLKSSTIRNNTSIPMWDLMMKNIYSLSTQTQSNNTSSSTTYTGTTVSVQKQGFQLRVIYKDDITGVDNPALQESNIAGIPLVQVMNLDKLNQMSDRQPDGNFDYVEDVTIDSKNGRVIFPVLEPFGSTLRNRLSADNPALVEKYVQTTLYRGTQIDATQETDKNKFYISGSYQGANGAQIQLGFGVDEKTVQVSAGGVALNPGTDFVVEAGSVRILNESLMNSGKDVTISWETPDLFNNQVRTMLAGRFDYRVDRNFNIGATVMRLRESTPGNITRVALGNEPVNNFLFGLDANLKKDVPILTKALDALPFLQTKEMSTIAFSGEYAQLLPGVTPRSRNRSYLDDFEGSRTIYDFTRQPIKWRLGATPDGFPKGNAANPLEYAYRRAMISVYNIDQTVYGTGGLGNNSVPGNLDVSNVYERQFMPQDIFKGKATLNYNLPLNTLDIAYFPSERGMYNYNPDLTSEGLLRNPKQNFGAITRAITSDNDFDNSNIELLEFWVMDPFQTGAKAVVKDGVVNQNNTTGGKLLLHLGDISEDVVPDGRFNFENGLPVGEVRSQPVNGQPANVDSTAWGRVTKQQFVINAFDNENIAAQDIGLDGLNNNAEQTFFGNYLNQVRTRVTGPALNQILSDPSNDDFRYYLSTEADQNNWSLVQRYKRIMGMENNSPANTASGSQITPSSSSLPDSEDLNVDNTVNETESYYEYEIPLKPGELKVGSNNIVDEVVVNQQDGTTTKWYLFRVEVRKPTRSVGGINGFKSVRFMRMVMTDFEQPVVLRFAQFQLTGFQYRKYDYDLNAKGLDEIPEPYDADFRVSTVSIEENGPGTKDAGRIPYVVPPGYERDRDIMTLNNAELNEQGLSLCVTDLRDGDSRAAYKLVNYNLNQYRRLTMSVHMENAMNESSKTSTFIRLGTDFKDNYYEIEVRDLKATDPGSINVGAPDPTLVWPLDNKFDFPIDELRRVKSERNRLGAANATPFTLVSEDGKYNITVVGTPDISAVQVLMLGVRNPTSADGQAKSFCVWVNEFHATDFDQKSGYAAIGRADIKLADFATVTLTGAVKTYGFGGVETRISERSQSNSLALGMASNVNLDKFFPQKWGLQIPFYFSVDRQNIRPHFNPLDPDMPLELSLSTMSASQREAYRKMVEENYSRKAINFSNVRKIRMNPSNRAHFYDIENFSFTYAYSDAIRSNITMAEYRQLSRRGGITYAFTTVPRAWEPFKKWKNDRHIFQLIKDFNFTPVPTSITLRADMDRSLIRTQYRSAVAGSTAGNPRLTTDGVTPLFEKYWLFNRLYGLTWNLSKNWNARYNATAQAIIDEPYGDINTQEKRDSVMNSLRNLGRMKNFEQRIDNTWQVPLNKTPLTDWMTAQLQYNVAYKFQANSYGIVDSTGTPFGNTIQNRKERVLTGRIDFVALYNRVKALRWVNSPRAPRRDIARSPGDFDEVEQDNNRFLKSVSRLLLTVRGIRYTYAIDESTILPGFMSTPHLLGDRSGVPGMPFILGSQDASIRYRGAAEGWISKSTVQNQPFVQTVTKRFEATTDLEPWKDFKVFMDLRYNRSDNYQEFFRPATVNGAFQSQSPVRSGSYSMSYLSFLTAFERTSRESFSANFERFKDYRNLLLDRLKQANPAGDSYNLNSQDVLIPAFFAAYSGKSPEKVKFSPFYKIPLPNWRVNYNGLTNVPWVKRRFSQVQITHSYSSTYNVGSFVSSLEYDAAFVALNAPMYPFADRVNAEGQFVPVYVMSVISFVERFAPFLGVQFRTKDGISGGLEYNQDRNVGLNLSNVSVNEVSNKDLTGRVGFTKQNVRFNLGGRQIKLKNDLTFDCRLTFRDQRVVIRKLEGETTPTAGNVFFQFNPSVTYNASRQLNVRVYLDRTVNDPLVSNSFRRALTQGGVQLRLSLN